MKPKLLFLFFLFTVSSVFAQKKYEFFPYGDTASYHVDPVICHSCVGVDTITPRDTIYNALKYGTFKVLRDTSKPVEVYLQTIKQDGKMIGWYKLFPGGCDVYIPHAQVARVVIKDYGLYTVTTFKDNQNQDVSINKNFEIEIAEFLIREGYL